MKDLAIPMTLTALLFLVGCANPVAADRKSKINVSIYENLPNMFTNENVSVAGFWPHILSYIASREGSKIEWLNGNWDQRLARPESEDIDMMPDAHLTDAQTRDLTFRKRLCYPIGQGAILSRDVTIPTIFESQGKKMGIMTDSFNLDGPSSISKVTAELYVDCSFAKMDNYANALQALDNDLVDSKVTNNHFADKQADLRNKCKPSVFLQRLKLGFAFSKGALSASYLSERTNNRIKALKEDTNLLYYQSLETWFKDTPAAQTKSVDPLRDMDAIKHWSICSATNHRTATSKKSNKT